MPGHFVPRLHHCLPLLAAAEWTHTQGQMALSSRLMVGGGAACFIVSMCSWWAMIGGLLESVDFPFSLPMGDLSAVVKAEQRKMLSEVEPSKME